LAKSGPSPKENVSKSCQSMHERLMFVSGAVNAHRNAPLGPKNAPIRCD
jgi:hypothetical protein